MTSIFDDIFAWGFGKPFEIRFETHGVKDMNPAIWDKNEEGNYVATVKTLGLEKVELEEYEYGIRVFGENEINGKKYNMSVKLPIAEQVMASILEVKSKTIAGLTFIELILEKTNKRKINFIKE